MQQMRIYSERTVNLNGITTRTGEDAYPFGNEVGMFVADGMGGGAGIPIIGFHPDCFDEDKLVALLLDGNDLDPEDTQALSDYIRHHFASLTLPAMKQLYENPRGNTVRLKKSGYVGSHALGVALAVSLMVMKRKMPELADSEAWETYVGKVKDFLFDNYQEVINTLGSEYARTTLNKIDFYGTTMTAAFYKENEDTVDVIFLNCGDSRSYIWDQKGFRQASEDQGRNGGMTSRFTTNPDVTVTVSMERKTYQKPCALMCMTDGFYSVFGGKNGFHSSPMYMEGYLMSTFGAVNSWEEAETRITNMFNAKGQIDDSNSMILTAFGYENYGQFKEAAVRRMNELNETYALPSMPNDFLVEDYQKKLQLLQDKSADTLHPLLQRAYELRPIQSYCLKRANSPELTMKYGIEVAAIQAETERVKQSEQASRELLCRIAEENFTDFADADEAESGSSKIFGWTPMMSPQQKAKEYGIGYYQNYKQRKAAIAKVMQRIQEVHDLIGGASERICLEVTQPWSFACEQDSLIWASQSNLDMKDLSKEVSSLLAEVSELSKRMSSSLEQWKVANSKAMRRYLEKGGIKTALTIVNEWRALSNVNLDLGDTTIPFIRESIVQAVQKNLEEGEKLVELEEKRKAAVKRAAQMYWEDNAARDILDLLENGVYFAPDPELADAIRAKLNENEELVLCRNVAEQQRSAFEKYLAEHLSEVSDDKRADVAKCGWM